jgi:hypothetical protein
MRSARLTTSERSNRLYRRRSGMTKYIPLNRGLRVLVDDADYLELSRHKWTAGFYGNNVYAVRGIGPKGRTKIIYMHRVILGLDEGSTRVSDHINGDGLDNRRDNLRACTRAENNTNVPPHSTSSHGYKGLMWDKRRGRYSSCVHVGGERHYVGTSSSSTELALARDIAALRLQGKYAWLNFPKEIIEALDVLL